MDEVKIAQNTIKLIEAHNEEQRLIKRLNEPMLRQLKEWVEKMEVNNHDQSTLDPIIKSIKHFLYTGGDLEKTKLLIKESLVSITKSKMEELNAYKH